MILRNNKLFRQKNMSKIKHKRMLTYVLKDSELIKKVYFSPRENLNLIAS